MGLSWGGKLLHDCVALSVSLSLKRLLVEFGETLHQRLLFILFPRMPQGDEEVIGCYLIVRSMLERGLALLQRPE